MIKNPQKVNSNIFGNRELSKEEHERIKNEKFQPIEEYLISIPNFVYQDTNFVQGTKEEFWNFKKQSNIKSKLNRDKKILNNVVDNFKRRYLNKEIDLEEALIFIEEDLKNFFSKKTHSDFYRDKKKFKLHIEQFFNQ